MKDFRELSPNWDVVIKSFVSRTGVCVKEEAEKLEVRYHSKGTLSPTHNTTDA